MEHIPSELREKALQLVREEFETAAQMRKYALRVGIDHMNRILPPSHRYESVDEVFRQYLARALAVLDFAARLGFVSPGEWAQITRDFNAAHPEPPQDEDWEIPSE